MSVHEGDLRSLLTSLADDVHDVAPLARPELRRTRVRRASLATALVMSVAAIGGAGALVAFRPGGLAGRGTAPAHSVEFPPPPSRMTGDPVAHGRTTTAGEWWLTAYERDGKLCVQHLLDDGSGDTDCDIYRPNTVTHFEHSALRVSMNPDTSPADVTFEPGDRVVVGWAADVTTTLEVALKGERSSTPLYDAPPGFSYPVKFFALMYAQPNLTGLLAHQSDGSDAAVIVPPTTSSQDGRFTLGNNIDVSVAEGKFLRDPYHLTVTVAADPCPKLSYGRSAVHGAMQTCSLGVPTDRHVGLAEIAFADVPDVIAVFGATSKDVHEMTLFLDDGRNLPLDIVPGPLGVETNFFVDFFHADVNGTLQGHVTARDESGAEIASSGLCPDLVRAGTSTTCTP